MILLTLTSLLASSESRVENLIPLKKAGRLFLIEAWVNGQRGNFVFDTGATGLVLNLTYFRSLSGRENQSGGISGQASTSHNVRIDEFRLGNEVFENIRADVTYLGHIENKRGVRILGLVGMDLLDDFEIIIDGRSQQLTLNKVDRKGRYLEQVEPIYKPDIIAKVVLRNGIMFMEGQVSGKSLDFCLDTGAESNVLCSSCRKNILSSVQINRRTTLSGVGGESVEVMYGAMTDFSVQEVQFNPMQTIITSLAALSAAYDFPVDGVLGYDFFMRGVIRINLAKKELGIKFYEEREN